MWGVVLQVVAGRGLQVSDYMWAPPLLRLNLSATKRRDRVAVSVSVAVSSRLFTKAKDTNGLLPLLLLLLVLLPWLLLWQRRSQRHVCDERVRCRLQQQQHGSNNSRHGSGFDLMPRCRRRDDAAAVACCKAQSNNSCSLLATQATTGSSCAKRCLKGGAKKNSTANHSKHSAV